MPFNDDEHKFPALDQLLTSLRDQPPEQGVDLARLAAGYFRHATPDELAGRCGDDLDAALRAHLALARTRPQGTAIVEAGPATPERFAAPGRSVLAVVTDDMPFLVDSVSMALDEAGHPAELLLHPQFVVRRDLAGNLLEILDENSSTDDHDVQRESWMHLEIADVGSEVLGEIRARLLKVLQDVREAVEDWPKMHAQVIRLVDGLREWPPNGVPTDEVGQSADFLSWLADDHFTFLGYREYDLLSSTTPEEGMDQVEDLRLVAVPGTGLGILRGDQLQQSSSFGKLPAPARARAKSKQLLVVAKANSRATVHRSVHLDYVALKRFDRHGTVIGECRFLGLFSSRAYTESVNRIPMLRDKAAKVIAAAGFEPMSHAGKSLMDVLETYPRDEMMQTPVEQLAPVALAVLNSRTRRRLRLFLREDLYGRFLSCLVYLPRDRYNTTARTRISEILKARLDADRIDYTARVSESFAARLHFVARPAEGHSLRQVDAGELEAELATAVRSWDEDLGECLGASSDDLSLSLARSYSDVFPEAYKEDYPAAVGAEDLRRVIGMGPDSVELELVAGDGAESRLKLFRKGPGVSLSRVLPMLTDMGVEVVDERPYQLAAQPDETYIYDFGLRTDAPLAADLVEPFQEAVAAVWDGRSESDSFNSLVLSVGLDWREAMMLRGYARYMQQGGTAYSQDHISGTLVANPEITRLLVELFRARFDPGAADGELRGRVCADLGERIDAALEEVARLDHDRVLRSYRTLIHATLRTNYFQRVAGQPRPWLAFKLDPRQIDDLPEPRPRFEIFVYSPRMEGVHLRFGSVARGGLRWSDRQDDFRTEVLGLVKAQMVKNTVIVPVGAKGGFVCKNLPDPAQRDDWLAEGVACYRMFITALLDLTDNLVDSAVVPPAEVVRHDADDTYLVVAADKGTATFSDIANSVAIDHGFWLGDAFASGGSVGYDHKAMGITAKGAWVSVQRHFREMGVDCQHQDFTAVGIGDMSGDVFGNGMLCSPHTRLVAAFDHRDIFIDPNPEAASSYAERQRLFDLPRSSWQDYDTSLISPGGGVFSRGLKAVPISPEIGTALGLAPEITSLAPNDLMRAILTAPVDLLWNGGIGTYVKGRAESDADAGDKANDAIRVDGSQLRCRMVGEGGNLGLTQLGRIEYAEQGGRINTDFIDNSAGVDTSDHEVNIKILLNAVAQSQGLAEEDRNALLASMTEEVGNQVLVDNYQQNLALASAESDAAAVLHVHEHWMSDLERAGKLNRELEALPSSEQVAARLERGAGLTTPELSVLLAYAKITLAEDLVESDLADDPFLRNHLFRYFPMQLRQDFRSEMMEHPLRREILVTQIVNELVNRAGMTYLPRLTQETGVGVVELTRANFVARDIFGTAAIGQAIDEQDHRVDAAVQTRMRQAVRTLAERVSRWLVGNFRAPLDSEALVDRFDVPSQRVVADLPNLLVGAELTAYQQRRSELVGEGVPDELAGWVAVLPPAFMVLGIVDTATREQIDPSNVARIHFEVGERLGLPGMVTKILALPRADRWQTMARASMLDDIHSVHGQLTAQVLAAGAASGDAIGDTASATAAVQAWIAADEAHLTGSIGTLNEILRDDQVDLARLSVALRVVRSLAGG